MERNLLERHNCSELLVLRVILDFTAGKAECWPGNPELSRRTGLSERAVQFNLLRLETAGTIRRLDDPITLANKILTYHTPAA